MSQPDLRLKSETGAEYVLPYGMIDAIDDTGISCGTSPHILFVTATVPVSHPIHNIGPYEKGTYTIGIGDRYKGEFQVLTIENMPASSWTMIRETIQIKLQLSFDDIPKGPNR